MKFLPSYTINSLRGKKCVSVLCQGRFQFAVTEDFFTEWVFKPRELISLEGFKRHVDGALGDMVTNHVVGLVMLG